MSAERDRNPPEEWADKVTHTPESEGREQDKSCEGELGFKVSDKRHWVEGEDEEKAEGAGKRADKPTYVRALEEELSQKDETLREYIAQYKAAKSRMNDAISRIEKEKAREVNFRIAELARTFLSILDDLGAAVEAAKSGDEVEAIRTGLELITQQINRSLAEIGIEPIEALGKPHDPQFHEAVAVHDVDDAEKDGIILEELKKGYTLGDVLVRPASVVVGKAKSE